MIVNFYAVEFFDFLTRSKSKNALKGQILENFRVFCYFVEYFAPKQLENLHKHKYYVTNFVVVEVWKIICILM